MADQPTPWGIIITPHAERQLRGLPQEDQARIRRALDHLRGEPRAADVRKLRGIHDEWRLRVGGLRVRYRPDRNARVIVVLQVVPRGRAY